MRRPEAPHCEWTVRPTEQQRHTSVWEGPVGGTALHKWVFGTRTFQKLHSEFAEALIGNEVGREGVDDDFVARGFENVGACSPASCRFMRPRKVARR
jgi:hypothetical protein